MKLQELKEFIRLLQQLDEDKQQELYFMLRGAAIVYEAL